jgi:peptidoglycan/LPS O-acetylase OafA/YrhL
MSHPTATEISRRPALAQAGAHARFRTDIEGLRGVSVAAVVLYHAFPTALPGGFIGVDIFFVISGFLIARILLDEHERTGAIDLIGFWCRRIRRILPAATVGLIFTALLILLMPAIDSRNLGKSVFAAALFYLNWRQAGDAVDYLAADDADNPAMHYWSLAVEEQFYLVWPLVFGWLLFLSARASQRSSFNRVAIAIAALAAVSFSYGAYLTYTERPLAFFSSFSRAWQFLAGALIAVASTRMTGREWPGWITGAASLACIATLVASFRLIDARLPYPGLIALIPTAAAALLIHLGTHRLSWGGTILANPVLRAAGLISFSWYLLHWPLIVAACMQFGDDPRAVPAAIALSFLLAAAMYVSIEKPIRTMPALVASKRKTLAFGTLLIAVGALTGFALRTFGPDQIVVGPGIYASAEAINRDRAVIYDDGCLVRQDDAQVGKCEYGSPSGTKSVVLFGDSHAANWFPALEAAARSEGWRLVVRTRAACNPVDAPQTRADGTAYPQCAAWRKAILEELHAANPDLIVLAGASNSHPQEAERRLLDALAAVAPIVVMRDTPRLPEDPITCLRRERDADKCKWSIDRLGGQKYPKTPVSGLPPNARVLDLNARLCPGGVCRAASDGWGLMTDPHHLTARTSRLFRDAFVNELRKTND